ncbi:chorismate mutase [Evansella caseinilytica]|uniref:chorismate mutase n=1 Tax=Evansella caseinilytica TaxID=1503961 RepID=A0A1H3NEU6_9BACI|nr:chorismate mutase [Evansella caseinilytica]SDY87190.1 chorismate mutase [Evansella caseinilytica]
MVRGVRGVRGAITVKENKEEAIVSAAFRLFKTMQKENGYVPDDISHIIITMTPDLDAAFPAKALRQLEGYDLVPVMCAQEIPVPGSLEKCIRVMLTLNTTKSPGEINHVYLEDAVTLRPDLFLTNQGQLR